MAPPIKNTSAFSISALISAILLKSLSPPELPEAAGPELPAHSLNIQARASSAVPLRLAANICELSSVAFFLREKVCILNQQNTTSDKALEKVSTLGRSIGRKIYWDGIIWTT